MTRSRPATEAHLQEEVIELLRKEFGPKVKLELEPAVGLGRRARPDFVVLDGDRLYVVEVKEGRADFDMVGHLLLYQKAVAHDRGLPERQIVPLIVASAVTPEAEAAIRRLGGRIVQLGPRPLATKKGKVTITSPKAWRLISDILAHGPEPLLRSAEHADVAYGWSHRVSSYLLSRGILERTDLGLRLSNMGRLFDGVAWERPFTDNLASTVMTAYLDPLTAADRIGRLAKRERIDVAFTGWTAGALYTRYARAFQLTQCYSAMPFDLESSVEKGSGIRLEILRPDREVFDSIRWSTRTPLVDPSICLLDLGGMGYSARDLALTMAENYAGIVRAT